MSMERECKRTMQRLSISKKMAAMQGHAESRYNLACCEGKKGNYDRAFRHLLISAKMGCSMSVGQIKVMFMGGMATKEQYAQALRGYQRK